MKTCVAIILAVAYLLPGSIFADDKPSSQVIGWGMNDLGQAAGIASTVGVNGPVMVQGHPLTDCVSISAGCFHGLALLENGTVLGWGYNQFGQATGTPFAGSTNGIVTIGGNPLRDVVSISAGNSHSLALLRNGRIVGWGDDVLRNPPAGLSNVIAISAGRGHSLALKSDGSVISWPDSLSTPFVSGLSNIVAIAATSIAWGNDIALRSDGTVIQWHADNGQAYETKGLSNVVCIATGGEIGHRIALKKDGTIMELPQDGTEAMEHPGLSNVVAIAASGSQCMALKRDGTVAVWGGWTQYTPTVPEGLTNVVAIAAGENFSLAIQTNSPGPITNDFPPWPKLTLPTP